MVALSFGLVDAQDASADVFETPEEFEKELDWSPPSLYLLKPGDQQHFSGTVLSDPLPNVLTSQLPAGTKSVLVRWVGQDGDHRRSVFVEKA